MYFQVMNMSRSEIARTLLHAGAMVNTQDTSYRTHGIDTLRTPCHDAAELGYKETVRVLVEHGAVITMQDNQGNTPAHLAAKSGNFDTMKYLSRALPVSSLKNHKGETILDLYQTHGILSRARKRWIERERSKSTSEGLFFHILHSSIIWTHTNVKMHKPLSHLFSGPHKQVWLDISFRTDI